MEENQIAHLLIELWDDIQKPAIFWQVGVLVVCLLMAGLIARQVKAVLHRRQSGDLGYVRGAGEEGLRRVVFPTVGAAARGFGPGHTRAVAPRQSAQAGGAPVDGHGRDQADRPCPQAGFPSGWLAGFLRTFLCLWCVGGGGPAHHRSAAGGHRRAGADQLSRRQGPASICGCCCRA
jgi:hypothetical protein